MTPTVRTLTLAALALMSGAAAQDWEQPLEYPRPGPGFFAEFGRDVDLAGDLAVVASPRDTSTLGSGIVSVYERAPAGGPFLHAVDLEAADTSRAARFGSGVACTTELVLVGTPGATLAAPGAGVVDVYERAGGPWHVRETLLPMDLGAQDGFGRVLAAEGGVLIVGAPGQAPAGAAYVYRLAPGGYTLEQKLVPSGAVAGDTFGQAVDTDGLRIVVGDNEAQGSQDRGRVYVYERDPTSGQWSPTRIWTGDYRERIGRDVAIDGPRIAATAGWAFQPNSPSVRTFALVAGSWVTTETILETPSLGSSSRCALDGDALLVGWEGSSGIEDDLVRVYRRDPVAGWRPARDLTPPAGGLTFRRYGSALAVDHGLALVGAYQTTDNPPFAGPGGATLRSYRPGLVGEATCFGAWTSSVGAPASPLAVGSTHAAANHLVLHAGLLPPHSFGYWITSRTLGPGVVGSGSQGVLCVTGAVGRLDGQVVDSGAAGTVSVPVDLLALPQPTGAVSALPGETWHFQLWFRDANPGATSNFTSAASVTFE